MRSASSTVQITVEAHELWRLLKESPNARLTASDNQTSLTVQINDDDTLEITITSPSTDLSGLVMGIAEITALAWKHSFLKVSRGYLSLRPTRASSPTPREG